jgi:hypothetical protein
MVAKQIRFSIVMLLLKVLRELTCIVYAEFDCCTPEAQQLIHPQVLALELRPDIG